MRWLLLLALIAGGCQTPDAVTASASPSPSPTSSLTPTPTPTLTAHPRPSGYTEISGVGVDILGEPGVAPKDLARVRAQAEASVIAIANDTGRPFDPTPTVYVFGTTASFVTGLQGVFQMQSGTAARVGSSAVAIALRPSEVALNWSELSDLNVLSPIHHELLHLMIVERLPTNRTLPAWLNEGSARLSETTLAGMQWSDIEIRSVTASLAATNRLFSWTDLEGPTFAGKASLDPLAAYSQSAEMVRFLRQRVGPDVLRRILARMDEGAPFDNAYGDVVGASVIELVTAFPAYVKELAAGAPAITVTKDAPTGRGPLLIAYGLPPGESIEVRLTNPAGRWSSTGKVAAEGIYESALDKLPAGTYHTVATAGGVTVSAELTVSH